VVKVENERWENYTCRFGQQSVVTCLPQALQILQNIPGGRSLQSINWRWGMASTPLHDGTLTTGFDISLTARILHYLLFSPCPGILGLAMTFKVVAAFLATCLLKVC